VSGSLIGWPVSAFHSRTVWSELPEAMRWPGDLDGMVAHLAEILKSRRHGSGSSVINMVTTGWAPEA
jgi:hypothetical protein